MMVSTKGSMFGLMRWQARNIQLFAVSGLVVVLLHEGLAWAEIPPPFVVPALPIAVFGGALGIFVSFRTNSAYDRWWEGRKLWGRLINTSRHFATQIVSWVDDPAAARVLVQRQIAYVHTLRVLLRGQPLADDADVQRWTTEADQAQLLASSNATHALLQAQSTEVSALADAGSLSELRLQNLDNSIRHLLDIQGGCERIKKTPLPRGYGFISVMLIRYYSVLLPFAMVDDLSWMTVPLNVLICLGFMLINETGRVLEDPFTLFWNALPLFALSKTIENNLRERLGDEDLDPLPQPDHNGVLM